MAKYIATVEDFQKLTNESGLVPMQYLLPTISNKVGDIQGAIPETALAWYQSGVAEPYDNPLPKNAMEAEEAALEGLTAEEANRRSGIVIDPGWATLPRPAKFTLAREISGEDVTKVADADAVIAEELDRRSLPNGGQATATAVGGLTSAKVPTAVS